MELIPAIDLIEGRCVRLSKGDYATSKVYSEQPLDVAKAFEAHGLKRVHVVDLDGAKARHIVNWKVLESIANNTSLTVDFGGGLKSDEDLRIAFECGAAMVTGGSIAAKNPEVFKAWLQRYGSERIILGADAKDEKISITGWTEETSLLLSDYIFSYFNNTPPVKKVICTDIGRDGMLEGPATELYRKILLKFPDIYLIASGGVSSMDDIYSLQEAHLPAVIFGKALYEGRITLQQIEQYIAKTDTAL